MEFDINPNELSLQGPDGMQLVQILRKLIVAIDGGDEPEPTPTGGLYYCTYGTTTSAQIAQAITDGLLPVCAYGGRYYYLVHRQVNIFTFFSFDKTSLVVERVKCNGSNWSYTSAYLQELLDFDYAPTQGSTNPVTSGGVWTAIQNAGGGSDIDPYQQNPAMDGSASPGSSDNYARGDHVHPTDTSRAASSEITRIDAALATKADAATMEQDIEAAVDDWLSVQAPSIGTLSYAAKQALLACFRKVAWIDNQGQTYYNALESELFPDATLESITAVFTQGSAIIYETDELDSLRQYLAVTATYSDSTTETITSYTLSGALSGGTSTITVSYGGKTDTFSVTVREWTLKWSVADSGLPTTVAPSDWQVSQTSDSNHSVTFDQDNGIKWVGSAGNYIISPTNYTRASISVLEIIVNFKTITSITDIMLFLANTGDSLIAMLYSDGIHVNYAADPAIAGTAFTINTDYVLRLERTSNNGKIILNDVLIYDGQIRTGRSDTNRINITTTGSGSAWEGYIKAIRYWEG